MEEEGRGRFGHVQGCPGIGGVWPGGARQPGTEERIQGDLMSKTRVEAVALPFASVWS